jgi:fucose 4-O-acetylase-like acetyltransferase
MLINISWRTADRDAFLDIAKGLAIILVVLGHVIQGSAQNFDELIGFRVIYSFHMPLFVFLSGAVAAIAFKPERVEQGFMASLLFAKSKIFKAVIRLLLPFISWCVINQLIYHHSSDVLSALVLAFRRPDTALWFLLAIFYCILLTCIFDILFSVSYLISQKVGLNAIAARLSDGRVQIVVMIVFWLLIKEHTPRGAGVSLLRPYFLYFLLGIGFYRYLYPNMNTWKYLVTCGLFLALIPFWSRTAPGNFIGSMESTFIGAKFLYFYAGLVAITGAFAILSLAKWISLGMKSIGQNFLILCGQLSLGIYATHYFFLSYSPKVIAPLLISVGLSYGMNQIPVLRTILLGEKWR